ncbi:MULTISPECIES: hypothetical protein [Nocardia]|uniref:hypothetical protein n=1 Tax=Nocardia TaxID=1817 RepID=UPI001E4D3AE6|nr:MULTISPECIES: hypothetical protein [Nocardia]
MSRDRRPSAQHPDRLTVVDEIFLRTHRDLGTPIALQGLWRTADHVDRASLEAVHSALRSGPLGRRVIRPAVPGARRRWQPTVRAHTFDYDERPIPISALFDWADRLGYDLDPEFGPGWRLAATRLDDGGSLVSLTCSHALADGRALVIAADRAIGSAMRTGMEATVGARPERPGGTPDESFGDAGIHGSSTARADSSRDRHTDPVGEREFDPVRKARPYPERDSDWSDAMRQWRIVLGGTARALRGGGARTAKRTVEPLPEKGPGRAAITCGAVVQCPTTEWEAAARSRGGTGNSLFIWLVANILWASGFPGDTIEASLPVDTRDEPRVDNDLAMTQIAVTRDDDPARIREKSRAAYEYRMTAPSGMPEEILQVIPDRLAHKLSAGAGERDILCSNIGPLPDSLLTLGPHRCIGVAARAIHPGLSANRVPRTKLSGYLCTIGGDVVLSLVSLDPVGIPSAAVLRELLEKVGGPLLPFTTW